MTTINNAERSRQITHGWFARLVALAFLTYTLGASALPPPDAWVPIRWSGGPLEIAWRTRAKTLPADRAVRDTLARWYEPETISLLDDSPVNCLLVTFSAPAEIAVGAEQQRAVKIYAEAAHKRGLAVLGLIYAEGDASTIAGDAARAALDGLVLDGDFAPDFPAALRTAARAIPVVEIARDAGPWRRASAPVIALAGMTPSGRNLAEMGIRGAPSSEPWIESNIWLVRSFSVVSPPRPVWISSELQNPSAIDYARAVADAAAAGGRWIISLDDALRAQLLAAHLGTAAPAVQASQARPPAPAEAPSTSSSPASALETWRRMCSYVKYAENYRAWRALTPYGNVGIVLDSAKQDSADEYLKLTARRQVAYRLLTRSELKGAAMATFRALLVTDLDPLSAAERKALQDFADKGGVVMAGPSWGDAPQTAPFTEIPAGKGRVIVYRDPDPETVARDIKEMLSDDELGVVPFNVPSVITYASGGGPGQPLVVQLVNYFDHPVDAITLRLAGNFSSARLETPETPALDLPLRVADGKTEVTVPKLLLWGAVSMQ